MIPSPSPSGRSETSNDTLLLFRKSALSAHRPVARLCCAMSGRSLDGLHLAPSAGPACEAVPRCLPGFDKPAASPHNISSPSDLLPLLWSFGLSLRPYLRSRFRRSCQSDSLVMPTDNVVAIYPTDSALNLQGNWTDFSLQNPQGNDQTVVFASSSASGSVKFTGKQPLQVPHSPFPVVSPLRLRC